MVPRGKCSTVKNETGAQSFSLNQADNLNIFCCGQGAHRGSVGRGDEQSDVGVAVDER
jgi:hypothetical protein